MNQHLTPQERTQEPVCVRDTCYQLFEAGWHSQTFMLTPITRSSTSTVLIKSSLECTKPDIRYMPQEVMPKNLCNYRVSKQKSSCGGDTWVWTTTMTTWECEQKIPECAEGRDGEAVWINRNVGENMGDVDMPLDKNGCRVLLTVQRETHFETT